jgi:hypothetical protein
MFDMGNEKTALDPPGAPWPATAYDENDVSVMPIWGVDNSALLDGKFNSAQVDTEGGWVLEASIPWSALMPGFVPADGTVIGFDINSGDNDDAAADKQAKLSWNQSDDEGWHDPSYFGNLQLDGYTPPEAITTFSDDFEDGVIWEGWNQSARSHSLSEANGMLTIAVDKPSDAEKWDGITMGFGTDMVLNLVENGWLSLDLKADENCTVDISAFDIHGAYNPGRNQLDLVGGAEWASMKFEYVGSNLIHYSWDNKVLGTVDASVINNMLMTFNGGAAWTGNVYMDNLELGIGAPDTAEITFMVDDTQNASHTALAIKGSWDTESGRYDAGWTDGAEHAAFYDDGTHGDETADDHIWTVMLKMIPDYGDNTWEWGVNDATGNWIDGNFQFTVEDGEAQTLSYYIEDAATITFVVDASSAMSHTAFTLKGSWDTESGRYDAGWTDGAEHADFYDDGTNGDVTADDRLFSVALELIHDAGANTWEWGVNDSEGEWLDGNFQFTLSDATDKTLDAYVITALDLRNAAEYQVYPVPASSTLYISEAETITNVELISVSGQVTMKRVNDGNSVLEIPVHQMNKGLYILRLTDNNKKVINQKVLIK